MKIEINKNELANALAALGKLVSRTSPLEVNHSIRIKGKNGRLTFETSNGEEYLSFSMESSLTEEFTYLTRFEEFRLAVKGRWNKNLLFEMEKDALSIDGNLLTSSTCVFPEAPNAEGKESHSEPLPASFVELLGIAAPIINRNEYRKVLQGILLSKDGITVTNGKELLNIPLSFHMEEMVLPFPLPLLATKCKEEGRLITWKEKEETFFKIQIGPWHWCGKALPGIYPKWKEIIPERKNLPGKVSYSESQSKEMIAFLKSIPDEQPHTAIEMEMKDKFTLILKCKEQKKEFQAELEDEKQGFGMSVNKEILMRLLSQGHTRIECASSSQSPFMATGGIGRFIAMPLFHRSKDPIQNATQTPQKENNIMSNEHKNVTFPPAAITQEREPVQETNPLEELSTSIEVMRSKLKAMLEESNALSRKIREVAITQKQKERDFVLAKRAIERIRMAI